MAIEQTDEARIIPPMTARVGALPAWVGCLLCVAAWAAGQTAGPITGAATEPTVNAAAKPPAEPERFSVHFQTTLTPQWYSGFHADYSGPNSLPPSAELRASYSATLFLGARLWEGGEVYADPEMFGGKGIGKGFGIAGFPNGDVNRVSNSHPDLYLARAFFRQTLGLGGEKETIDADQNQLAKSVDISRLTFTAGKFSAADVLDANAYAHDPRTQFMNWPLFDNGAWDYPADIRGYTIGAAVELNQKQWAMRYGIFLEPDVAGGAHFDYHLDEAFGQSLEYEQRYSLHERPGKARLMVYLNQAHMGDYSEAALLPQPDITRTRRYSIKYGVGLNIEQSVSDDLGLFSRLGWNDGLKEDWAFTEIDRTASLGMSLKGTTWSRPDDVLGLAGVINGLSQDHRRYLEAGGIGFIIGDGRLHYDAEEIIETYYALRIVKGLTLTTDFQFINHPAYNRDRGPVYVGAVRVHYEF